MGAGIVQFRLPAQLGRAHGGRQAGIPLRRSVWAASHALDRRQCRRRHVRLNPWSSGPSPPPGDRWWTGAVAREVKVAPGGRDHDALVAAAMRSPNTREALVILIEARGPRVTFEGVVARDGAPEGGFLLSRFIIAYCVADAIRARILSPVRAGSRPRLWGRLPSPVESGQDAFRRDRQLVDADSDGIGHGAGDGRSGRGDGRLSDPPRVERPLAFSALQDDGLDVRHVGRGGIR